MASLLLTWGCRDVTCGDVRMVDRATDTCVCRPEFTEVDDLCVPNEELDGGTDARVDVGVWPQ